MKQIIDGKEYELILYPENSAPKWDNSKGIWYCAREMCEVKNYMFPEIKMKQCIEFNSKLIDDLI